MKPRRELRKAPPPVEANTPRVVLIGTLLWTAALLALLPFADTLAAQGRGRWIPICIAGVALGCVGLVVTRRRERRLRASGEDPDRT